MSLTEQQLRERFPNASDAFLRANLGLGQARAKLVQQIVADFSGIPVGQAVPGGPKKRLRQDTKGPNKTEAAFYAWLEAATSDQVFPHAITFLLANGVRYTPDAIRFTKEGRVVAYEVKGHMRDDAAVKIKVAASRFPKIIFRLATKKRKRDGGGWAIEEIFP